ncbi:B18 subunit of NADH:ubiquinone oxidoreductase [Fomitopsis betulina]|nr:B18 subunit of NADH:ubiquinone oxidoreductase [Fomitopsis betulina]
MASSTTASQEELKQHKIPVAWRDQCSALLIPLNVCRKDKYYLPWECENEKHAYEKCQYEDYVRRMKVLSKQKAAERAE